MTEEEEKWLQALWKRWQELQEKYWLLEPILERQEQAQQRLFTYNPPSEEGKSQEQND